MLSLSGQSKRLFEWVLKTIPIAGLISVAAYVAAKQAVTPQRRVIKTAVLLWLLVLMMRFDMVNSVYLFTLLFPFPSGVALGSTNSIFITIILVVWLVRAASTKARLLTKTSVDVPIILFIGAYVISFFNVETHFALLQSVKITWRQFAAIAFFYMIVRFVDDEIKFRRITKLAAGVATFVMFTATVELFFPGAVIIPGWIGLKKQFGTESLTYRVEGIRVGGAFSSHGMLSDYATISILFMIYFCIRARNPLGKFLWGSVSLLTFTVLLATANRGAMLGFTVGIVYLLFLLRRRLSLTKYVLIFATIAGMFAGAQIALDKYTYATSLADRMVTTQFEGIIPDTRIGTWKPAFRRAFNHIFIGHGPFYATGIGLEQAMWPHNAYLFFLNTIGMFGLGAFIFIVVRVMQLSLSYRKPFVQNTFMGDITMILHVQLVMSLIEQLRTDQQRDDIYVYIVWMLFGLATAGAHIIKAREDRLQKESIPADPLDHPEGRDFRQ